MQDNSGIIKVCNRNPSGRGIGGEVYSAEGLAPTICVNKGSGYTILEEIGGGGTEEPQVMTPRRTPEGREHRRLTKGKDEHFSQRMLVRREDGVSNTLTTVLKDNLFSIPIGEMDEEQVSSIIRGSPPYELSEIPVSTHPLGRALEFRGFSTKGTAPTLRASDHKCPSCVIVEGKPSRKELISFKLMPNGNIRAFNPVNSWGVSEIQITNPDNISPTVIATRPPNIWLIEDEEPD